MDTRTIPRTGLAVSELCLGTMAFGGGADEDESARIFQRARDAGVNMFDCADVYNAGRAEEILGRLTRDCRDEVVIATKGYFPTGRDINARGASRYHLVRAVEASLKRLGTDRIDLYFLHRHDDVTPLEETLRALEDLVRRGLILDIAASNFAAWQVAKGLGIAARNGWNPLCALQPMYNLAKRTAEVELLPMAHSERVAVFPYSPLGGGLLSGKYGSGKRPDAGRLVDNAMYTTRYGAPQNLAIADAFVAHAAARGDDPVALAIAWVAAHPTVTAPIIGPRTVAQLESCLASIEIRLGPDEREAISGLSPAPPPATDRNEEASAHNYGAVTEQAARS